MTVKELIIKVRRENVLIKHKEEELQRLETLCGVSGISYDLKEGSGTRNVNKNEQSYLKYIEFKDELNLFIAEALESRKKLMEMIDRLDNIQCIKVMNLYCMKNYTLQEIANEKKYTKQAVHKIYLKALRKMEKELTKVDES